MAADAREALERLGLQEASLNGWKAEVAQRAGEDVGLVLTKGCEIHFVIFDPLAHRAMSRKNTLKFLKPVFEEFGYVTTRVPIAETDHTLRERLGFTFAWQDERFTYWTLTELPFQRRH